MNLSWLKEWRILVFLAFVIGAIVLILPSPGGGVLVQSVASDSPLYGKLATGEVLSWANEKNLNDPLDLAQFENFTGTFRFMHNGRLDLADIPAPGLKITVIKKPTSNLNFGLDIIGGTRVLLKPKDAVDDLTLNRIIATLQTRINVYGLREARFQAVRDVSGTGYVQIEMAGGTREEVEGLLARQGKFDGRIPRSIALSNGTGTFRLADTDYIVRSNTPDRVTVGNMTANVNETFNLQGIDWEVTNVTGNSAEITAIILTGTDIRSVCTVEQPGVCTSRVMQMPNGWEFAFQVFISQESAQRFATVTKGMKAVVDPATGDSYLDSKLLLYLDENMVSDLRISSQLAGQALTEPSITGGRANKADASAEMLQLQSVLSSGALPVGLEIIRIDQISPTLGQEFARSALIAGCVAALAVASVIFIRYRRLKFTLPIILTSVSEVLVILGAAAVIKWTIDLSAIAGIIATVGTGVNAQIIILDEMRAGGAERVYTMKQKIKRAFFIIFGSASTVIAAMIPMLFIGIGVMRGFAITTIIGVLLAVFITRPAFSRIAEKLMEREHAAV